MPVNYEKPLLTMKQVEEMYAERDRIAEEIQSLQDKKAMLDRKIAAAAEFMDGGEAMKSTSPVTAVPSGEPWAAKPETLPMTEAVERIVGNSARPLTLKEVKSELAQAGYPKSRLGNYFYTVMRRLTEYGRIDKRGDKFTAPSPSTELSGVPNENA